MSNVFVTPGLMITGENALDTAASHIAAAGTKALVVTDPTMVKVGNVKRVTDLLDSLSVGYAVYDGVTGEPNDNMVAEGKKAYLDNGCDFLIAIGGGSPIDTMKAVGAMITNPGEITDYLGKTISNAAPPTFAVPTTAGTGSEATQFTIITDTKRDVKMLLKGEKLIPSVAIVDYRFSMTAPPKVTAATGLDALCHAVESYTSRKAQPISDLFALEAVKKIFRYLPRAFENGGDEEARESHVACRAGSGYCVQQCIRDHYPRYEPPNRRAVSCAARTFQRHAAAELS
jgi:alcohol dehydrogenase class IV